MSLTRLTDFLNYIGEAYSIESILEALLRFFQDRRHRPLNVAANRASLLDRIIMDRECRRRRTGPINVQKRYLFSRPRKDAAAVLAARSGDQTGIG